MTSKGQVTVPKAIRDALGLVPGDRLEFTIDSDGRIIVRRKTRSLESVIGMLKSDRRATIEEIEIAIREGWVSAGMRGMENDDADTEDRVNSRDQSEDVDDGDSDNSGGRELCSR